MIFDDFDLEVLQLIVADRHVTVAIEFEALDDLVAAQLLAGLAVDKPL